MFSMKIRKKKENIIIEEVKDFLLSQTLECGQCFRFEKLGDEEYVIVANNRLLHIKQEKDTLVFYNTSKEDVVEFWIHYFDLDKDYRKIKNFLRRKDEKLRPVIKDKWGIRILNQDFHETLISFIISQNKQIPHIKQLVENLSNTYGKYLGTIEGKKYYAFPTINKLGSLTEKQWRDLKVGFRAPYLLDASTMLSKRRLKVNSFFEYGNRIDEKYARNILTSIKGVGDKVANCVMLFSLGYSSSFPIDVWIKRIMETMYFDGKEVEKEEIAEFAKNMYGEYGGYAQQYLFCYGRDNNLGK